MNVQRNGLLGVVAGKQDIREDGLQDKQGAGGVGLGLDPEAALGEVRRRALRTECECLGTDCEALRLGASYFCEPRQRRDVLRFEAWE
jgi:hypothetical protein